MKYLKLFESYDKNYYILYHGTDSDFFDTIEPTKAKKGEDNLYHNPLGDGIYLSDDIDFVKNFGENIFKYYLPKDSNIKFYTKENYEDTFLTIVEKTIDKLGFDLEELDQMTINHIMALYKWQPTQIKMLVRLAKILSDKFKIDLDIVGDTMTKISTELNSQYDAVWFDYGEIIIPFDKFDFKQFRNN